MKINLEDYLNSNDYGGNKIISHHGRWCLKAGPCGFLVCCLTDEDSNPLIGASCREWLAEWFIDNPQYKAQLLNQSFIENGDEKSVRRLLLVAEYLSPPEMKIETVRTCGAGTNKECSRLKRVVDCVRNEVSDLENFISCVHDHKGWLTVWFRGRDLKDRAVCEAFTKAWTDESEPEEYVTFDSLS